MIGPNGEVELEKPTPNIWECCFDNDDDDDRNSNARHLLSTPNKNIEHMGVIKSKHM